MGGNGQANTPFTPTAAGMARARYTVDLLICQHCGGFLGDGPDDRDRSCICYNHAHAVGIRLAAREYQRSMIGRRP